MNEKVENRLNLAMNKQLGFEDDQQKQYEKYM